MRQPDGSPATLDRTFATFLANRACTRSCYSLLTQCTGLFWSAQPRTHRVHATPGRGRRQAAPSSFFFGLPSSRTPLPRASTNRSVARPPRLSPSTRNQVANLVQPILRIGGFGAVPVDCIGKQRGTGPLFCAEFST